MVKQFIQDGESNKQREMNNYKLLKEKGISQQFVKIYDQNLEETKLLYEHLNPCIIMEAGQISLDQLFKNKKENWDFERIFSIFRDLRKKIKKLHQ